MKIEITPRHFAELFFDMRVLISAAQLNCEGGLENVKEIDRLLSEISDKMEEIEMAASDIKSALSYIAKCMEEY